MVEIDSKKSAGVLILTLLIIFLFSGCFEGSGQSTEEISENYDDRLSVVCTIFPQYDFVRQIAGDKVNLKMLIHPGADVHYYEPTPQDIIQISESDLFIYVGGESDEWADKILSSVDNGSIEVISMMECSHKVEEELAEGMWDGHKHSYDSKQIEEQTDGTFSVNGEDHESENNNVEYDEHVWTSIDNSVLIVSEIRDTLCKMDEKNADYYRANAADYIEELKSLKQSISDVVDHAQRKTLVFGDRFPLLYFVKEFGLEYKAAFKGCASDSEAGAETVAYLSDYVSENHIPVVFKLELSSGNIASVISRASGAELKTFYTCHNLSKEDFDRGETYVSMMQKNIKSLEEALN